jgi:hypothetical protein
MTTKTERLDELLGMARHVGFLDSQATAAEHRANMAPRGRTRQPRREARELSKLAEVRAGALERARARFVCDVLGGEDA